MFKVGVGAAEWTRTVFPWRKEKREKREKKVVKVELTNKINKW
jgi:hypothetical protein